MSDTTPTVPARDLLGRGYVQEANRLFFHPLGMALGVNPETGAIHVFDSRSDPEGFVFGDGVDEAKARYVAREWERKAGVRKRTMGFVTQPVGPYDPKPHREPPPGPPQSVLRRRPFSRRATPPETGPACAIPSCVRRGGHGSTHRDASGHQWTYTAP